MLLSLLTSCCMPYTILNFAFFATSYVYFHVSDQKEILMFSAKVDTTVGATCKLNPPDFNLHMLLLLTFVVNF